MNKAIVLGAILLGILVVTFIARALLGRRHAIGAFDLADLGGADGDVVTVLFTSPYCHGCKQWAEALDQRKVQTLQFDVAARPDLANKYKISVTPRLAVARVDDGSVLREFDHYTPREHDLESIDSLISAN